MKLHYTLKNNVLAGHSARNPRRFESAERLAEQVVIDGDFPHIAQAYKEIDVPVLSSSAPEPHNEPAALGSLTVPELKKLASERGINHAANITKPDLLKLLSKGQGVEE